MTSGFQARTTEYRWPVVDATEPKGVRTIRGYVTILLGQTEGGAPLSCHVMFQDVEGRPFQSIDIEDIDIFYDAAQAALVEMGLRTWAYGDDRPIAGEIIR